MLKWLVSVTILLVLAACSGSYSFKLFSFPEDSKPHENNWSYLGRIIVYDPWGVSSTESVEKKLTITIENRQGELLLDEKHKVVGGTFNYDVLWKGKDELHISIMGAVPESSKPILELDYTYNGKHYVRKKHNKN